MSCGFMKFNLALKLRYSSYQDGSALLSVYLHRIGPSSFVINRIVILPQ